MSHQSEQKLLILHAVRLLGFADEAAVASHAGSSTAEALLVLREAQGAGWVQHLEFFDVGGWSLTDLGKCENERQLALERQIADPDNVIAAVYRDFLPLNARMLRATTDWQIRPCADDMFAVNDHCDSTWDSRVLDEIEALGTELAPLVERLSSILTRFDGSLTRYESALCKTREGKNEWIDRTDVDSCHRVWFQLHEDFLATLSIDRGSEA